MKKKDQVKKKKDQVKKKNQLLIQRSLESLNIEDLLKSEEKSERNSSPSLPSSLESLNLGDINISDSPKLVRPKSEGELVLQIVIYRFIKTF